MNSRLYDARVSHERHFPEKHQFQYRVPVFVFDLAELESGTLDGPLFGRRVTPGSDWAKGPVLPRLLSLREADYLYDEPSGLRHKIGKALAAGGLDPDLAKGAVRLVTSARFLGYAFNPVNFWLLFKDEATAGLAAAVAEVNNTFGEKHLYVLGNGDDGFPAKYSARKAFHVSPFNDMRGDYQFIIQDPRRGLDLSVNLIKDGKPLLEARLWSETPGRPVDANALAGFLLHPQRVLTYPRIVKEAARLYFRRRLPVHTKPSPTSPMTIRTADPNQIGIRTNLTRRIMKRLFNRADTGSLTLKEPDGSVERFQGVTPGPEVELKIRDPRFYRAVAKSGDIGFGEAYVNGWWTTPNLPELIRFMIINREPMRVSRALRIPEPAVALFNGVRRLGGRRNTRAGAKENIHAHYDLGNEMFAAFLDPSMAYSCAYFEREDMTLAEAQEAKFRLAAEKLDLKPGDKVLEIGCGWGGFAMFAAENCGCRVDGVTISESQLELARARAKERGLDDKARFMLMDYRDIKGTYDKIVSIEMLEAVGHQYHGSFLAALDRLLAPGGTVFIQFIAIHDQRYEAYHFQGDWIRKYIFPGGVLPSLTRIMEVVRDKTGFTTRSVEAIGPHYARTLSMWRENFGKAEDELEALGYDETFRNMWDYYFAYCEAGFSCRVIDDYQIVLARPDGVAPKH